MTPDIVLATIGKLGSASASEIAKELSVLGDQVSGRAVRWLAERAGAATVVGEDGQLRYRLPTRRLVRTDGTRAAVRAGRRTALDRLAPGTRLSYTSVNVGEHE